MAVLTSGGRHALPDSAFAYIEPGHDGEKVNGRTPDKYRHFPVHDAAHARNALARIGQGAARRFAQPGFFLKYLLRLWRAPVPQ